ncbi:MAG: LD-carboxypeptidase [Clostridiales bacterium]|nr:LD-carboxypeptidase [Clostridiales bacterium]
MKRPLPLSVGDQVALVAPSSPLPDGNIERAIDSIRFLGLEPVVFPSCMMSHGYLAGKDADRARDINEAFADERMKGIFCLRGGFGATRILNMLDLETIQKNPKVFAGYSDITALHLAFTQKCGLITFHAPMPNTRYREMDAFTLKSLKDNLFSDQAPGEVLNPPDEIIETIVPGICEGAIIGGNLSLLLGTLGSPYEVDTKDKILFIEEVSEMPYRLDRALTALALAGKFENCAGIILGTFAECEAPASEASSPNSVTSEESLTLRQIFDEVVKPFNKPTILNFRAGHVYPQATIPMGAPLKLDATNGRLVFLDMPTA